MKKAFTLIEALVASALAAMVMGILIGTLYEVRANTQARQRMARNRDATEFVHQLLGGDLAGAIRPAYFPGVGEPDEAGGALIRYAPDYFSLLTTHNVAAAAEGRGEGPALVTYRIRTSGQSYALVRTEYRVTLDADRAAAFEMLVLSSDYPMRFRYLTISGEWTDEIPLEQHRHETPPLAVAFRLAHDQSEIDGTEWMYAAPAWRLAHPPGKRTLDIRETRK